MSVFSEVFKNSLKTSFQYRWSFLISVLFDPLVLILYVSLLNTIYQGDSSKLILGYTCTQMIWYFAAIKFFYYLVWGSTDKDLSDSILSGEMAIRLTKPVSVMGWELAKSLASKTCSVLFEFIPSFLVFSLLVFPDFLTLEAMVKYLIITCLSFLLFFLFSFMLGTVAFRWQSTESLQILKIIIINIIAGASIPIEFFPDAVQSIIRILPFQYLYYVPITFFLNKPETQSWAYFFEVIGIMLVWIVVFYVLGSILWKRLSRLYTPAGG